MTLSPMHRQILAYFQRYWHEFALGAVFLLATNYMGLQIPAHIGDAIAKMQQEGWSVVDDIHTHGLWIMGLAAGAGITRVLSRVLIFNAGRRIEFDVRNDIYVRLTQLSQGWFGTMPTGDLTSRANNDVNFVRVLYAITFLHLVNTALAYILGLQKMAGIDPLLTLVCLAPFPLIMLVVLKIVRALFNQTKLVQGELANISSKIQENLSGCTVVRAYAIEDRERAQFGSLNENYVQQNVRLVTIRGALQATMAMISGIGTLMVLVVGAQRVADGTMTLGQFVEFNGYVVALAFPTAGLAWVFSVWNRGLAAFERVFEILSAPLEILPNADAPRLPDGLDARGQVQFDRVSFSYPNGFKAIQDVTFEVPAGSRIAVVGRTGSGKTTLVRLISRLWDPTDGTIRIDGLDLRGLPLRQTRSEIGVVPQDPFLFSMSIADNVRFGVESLEHDPTLHREPPTLSLLTGESVPAADRVRDALTIAGLTDDLGSFPAGVDTLVGERGVTLSGGQKQRVTIARALVMDPRILVLDDALASVDTQTETTILDHLERLMAGRTTIMVTHRFNALNRVDKILVIDEGRLVESGTHDELLANGGLYAELFENQKLQEELQG